MNLELILHLQGLVSRGHCELLQTQGEQVRTCLYPSRSAITAEAHRTGGMAAQDGVGEGTVGSAVVLYMSLLLTLKRAATPRLNRASLGSWREQLPADSES